MLDSPFLDLAKAVWRARVTWFWPIWIITTVAAAIGVGRAVGFPTMPITQKLKNKATNLPQMHRPAWPRRAVAALTWLALFLVCYVVLILTWEDFTYYDNSQFTLFTLRDHDFAPPIWQFDGRFFPFGLQEFNLIRHFTGTVAGYHVLPIVQLLILSCVLLILDDELSLTARVALTTFALVTPGIVISFGALICTERNVVFCLACLVLFVKRFEQTRSAAWAVAAVTCAQIMIYYKETAFLLLLGFAIGRLILRCRNVDGAGWDYNRFRDKESRLDLCLVSLGVLFLLYYVAVMLPHPNMQYADQARLPPAKVFLAYTKLDLLAWLFLTVVLARTYLILRHRVAPSPLWDGLALGGVACFAAHLYLGMFRAYYLAPVDLIAVLYVGRLAILSGGKMHLPSRVASLVLLFVVLLQDVSFSAFWVFERKNIIHEKAEIACAVEARYQNGAGNAKRLFFPFARPYLVMEFASYLDYRGVPVEGATVESGSPNKVVVVSRAVTRDGRCAGFRSLMCHAGSRPDPGDLVIVLPDDNARAADVAPYRLRGELLLSCEPRPHIPQWLYPFVRRLHLASAEFAQKELPDSWLHALVTVWN